jgi:hypothetical protein
MNMQIQVHPPNGACGCSSSSSSCKSCGTASNSWPRPNVHLTLELPGSPSARADRIACANAQVEAEAEKEKVSSSMMTDEDEVMSTHEDTEHDDDAKYDGRDSLDGRKRRVSWGNDAVKEVENVSELLEWHSDDGSDDNEGLGTWGDPDNGDSLTREEWELCYDSNMDWCVL